MSREQFVADVARLDPDIRPIVANPGDVFTVNAGKVTHAPGASRVATMLEDDTAFLRFDPTAPVPPLTDPNPDDEPLDALSRAVDECMEGFLGFVRESYRTGDAVAAEYRKLRAAYAIGVVLPDGSERWYWVRFGEHEPRCEAGSSSPRTAGAIHRIAASVLLAWARRTKSYFYFRAYSRKFSTLYALSNAAGGVKVEAKPLEDLLGYYLMRKAEGADMALKQRLDFQLLPYDRSRRTPA
jgi:hypothetical protein